MPSCSGGQGIDAARCLLVPAATFVMCLPLLMCAQGPGAPPPPPPGAIPAGQSIGDAAIEGRVTFAGPPPPRRPIRMTSEAACHKPDSQALSEDVIVSVDGALKNVRIHVVSGLGDRVFAPPQAPAVMDQSGCAFVPHVLDAQVNQPIEFTNGDPVVHNVRASGGKNPSFNVSMPARGKSVRRYFPAPGEVGIRCDIHAWMNAFVTVDEHPFHQVTGTDGTFALKGLPAGEYVLEAWHEKLGTKRQTVKLAPGETGHVDFRFGEGGAP